MMRSLLCVLLTALSACSLIVDSSENGLKCAATTTAASVTERQCKVGYSCAGADCVQDKSVREGETCTQDRQCTDNLLCPREVSVCSKVCTKIYDLSSECGPDQACVPVPDDAIKGKFKSGACIKYECSGDAATADAFCKANTGKLAAKGEANRCIRAAKNGGVCLPGCTAGKRAIDSPNGADQCVLDARENPQHCGRIATGDFICTPVGGAEDGAKCTLYPQGTGTASEDACNIGRPGLPLLCLNAKGNSSTLDGELRCRRAACSQTAGANASCPQTPIAQVCSVNLDFAFCKGVSE